MLPPRALDKLISEHGDLGLVIYPYVSEFKAIRNIMLSSWSH